MAEFKGLELGCPPPTVPTSEPIKTESEVSANNSEVDKPKEQARSEANIEAEEFKQLSKPNDQVENGEQIHYRILQRPKQAKEDLGNVWKKGHT